jgi:hypothetical protein
MADRSGPHSNHACGRCAVGVALMYRAGSAAQAAWSRELVRHPPAPALVADEAVTASVVGVRRFPLARQPPC